MARALYLNGSARGHINPTLPLVEALVQRGEHVTYLSGSGMKTAIEAAGGLFLDCGPELDEFHRGYRPSGDHPFFSLMEYLLAQNDVMAKVALARTVGMEFDYVIHDAMLGGGHTVAMKLGLPAVCTCTSFASAVLPLPDRMLQPGFHPQLDVLYHRYCPSMLAGEMKELLAGSYFQREELNIVFTSRLLQPGGAGFDESFRFVGPAIRDRGDEDQALEAWMAGKPVLYIAMGTIHNNLAEFYRLCIEALSGSEWAVVLAVGGKTDVSALGVIPPNLKVMPHAPQLQVLKHAKAFISHCGLNSAGEAMLFGVPIVAVPIMNDQPAVANQLVKLGAAVQLDITKLSPEILRKAVEDVSTQPSFAEACRCIGDSFRQAGGADAAADSVAWYLREKTV